MADTLRLRLPNTEAVFSGDLPASFVEVFTDLTDERLHLDPLASTVGIDVRRTDDGWQLRGGGADFGEFGAGPAEEDLIDVVVGRCNRRAFHLDPARLHLHAATVELDGVGILLAGPSGSGKSTVTLELLRRGAAYLGEESLTVMPGTRTVFAYPKPLTLKAGSLEWAQRWKDHPASALTPAANGRAHLRGGAVSRVEPFTNIGVVVSVRHTPDAAPSLRAVDPAAAAIALLSDTLDGVRMGPGSLEVLAPVVAGASCWELDFRDAEDAAGLIADLRPPLRRQIVVPYRTPTGRPDADRDSSAGTTSDGSVDPLVSSDTTTRVVCFDRSSVLHDGATRALLHLDDGQVASLGRPLDRRQGERVWASVTEHLDAMPRLTAERSPGDPLGFGLPGRPIDATDAPPLAERHVQRAAEGRCTGVLADQVARGRPCDPGLRDAVFAAHASGQSTCLLLERELGRVVDLLDGAGVEPVVMKGPVSAYDGPLPEHFRDFGDLDLLIPEAHMDAAVTALGAAGFERLFPQVSVDFDRRFAKSVTFAAPFSGDWEGTTAPTFEVDLHRTLAPGPFGARVPLEDLHRGAIPVRIERRWYRALHPTHRFVHQCLHAVLGSPVPRLHSLRDLVLSAPRTPDEVTHTVEVARAWRVAAVVDAAVRMGEARFPGAFLVDLVDAVQAERVPARDRLLIASYNRGSSSYALPAVLTVPELPSWRDRWDFLIAHVAHRVRSRAAAPGSRIS